MLLTPPNVDLQRRQRESRKLLWPDSILYMGEQTLGNTRPHLHFTLQSPTTALLVSSTFEQELA